MGLGAVPARGMDGAGWGGLTAFRSFRSRLLKSTPYFRITQIAQRCDTTRQTVYNWLKSGRLRPARRHPVDGASYWLEKDLPPLSK
jgi:predicted DNA-binding transcriptional regulator AlpA